MTHHGSSYSNGSSNGVSSNGQSRNGKAPAVDNYSDDTAFNPLYAGSSIDRKELVRLTLQSLRELGYESAAKALENESGIVLEHASITAFRSAVLTGDWRNAERLLVDGLTYAARRLQSSSTAGSSSRASPDTFPDSLDNVLRRPEVMNLDAIRFKLQKQRYLELLEARQTKKALSVLREKLTPLSPDTSELHLLSSLVVSATPEELRSRSGWDGARGESRRLLLVDIESTVSPTVMVPSRRLPKLLEQAQSYQKQQDPFFNQPFGSHFSLLLDHQSDRSVFPSQVSRTIRDHNDEVWCLAYSHDGTKLATAGADKSVLIWDVESGYSHLMTFMPLSDDISSVAWSPDDKKLLVTSDLDVTLCQLNGNSLNTLRKHDYTVGTAAWLPDGTGFVTGGMDGKIIFWDSNGEVTDRLYTSPFRVLSVATTPDGAHLVALSQRPVAPLVQMDVRGGSYAAAAAASATVGTAAETTISGTATTGERNAGGSHAAPVDLAGGSRVMTDQTHRIQFFNLQTHEEIGSIYLKDQVVSVATSKDSQYALINVRPNELQMWDIARQSLVRRFNGHKVSNFVIGCGFGGIDDNFVLSGSEDSRIYVWHRATGRLIETLSGHETGSVNAVCWNPKDPLSIASCGDDGTVRIWRPGGQMSTIPTLKRDPHPTSDDSDMGAIANPFPWSYSDSPSVPDRDMDDSMHEELNDTPSPDV